MIHRLIIHRFRGIREGVLDNLGKINLLIGPNNSGKTAVLEMLYLSALAHRPCSFVNLNLEPSAWPAKTLDIYDFLGLEPLPRLRQRHGEAKTWKDSPADISTDGGSLVITLPDVPEDYLLREFELTAPLDSPGRRRAFSQKDVQRISMFQLESWEDYLLPANLIPPVFQKYNVRLDNGVWNYLWEDAWVYRWEKAKGIDYFSVWAIEGMQPKHVVLFDFHVAEQHFTERFGSGNYEEIPDWKKKITQSLALIFPELKGSAVSIGPKKGKNWTGFIEFAGKTPLPIDYFGDGARHAFKVLASLIALSEKVDEKHLGLFLWEDPELFMHPATLGRLLEEVWNLVSKKPVQVFITTQSLEVIAWMANLFRNAKKQQDILRFYSLNLHKGRLEVHPFGVETVIDWLKGGLDLREIDTGLVENFPLTWKLSSETSETGGAPW